MSYQQDYHYKDKEGHSSGYKEGYAASEAHYRKEERLPSLKHRHSHSEEKKYNRKEMNELGEVVAGAFADYEDQAKVLKEHSHRHEFEGEVSSESAEYKYYEREEKKEHHHHHDEY